MAVESEVDVGGEGLRVIHAQHPLKNERGFVLVGEGIDGIGQDVAESSHVTVAVSDVYVYRAVRLDEHLDGVFVQL